MASLSIGTHHLHTANQLKKHCFHSISSTPLSSLPFKSSFGSSLCKLRGSRILGNGLLARAEDRAQGSSPPPPSSSNKRQGQQPNIDNQLQVLFYVAFSLSFNFKHVPFTLFCWLVNLNFRFWHIMRVNLVLSECSALRLLEIFFCNFIR